MYSGEWLFLLTISWINRTSIKLNKIDGVTQMESTGGKKSYAFVTAYLLGVEEGILKRDYADDFAMSGELEKFKQVENANFLRALSKVKQFIIKNYEACTATNEYELSEDSGIVQDVELLLEHEIDVRAQLGASRDMSSLMNTITKHINRHHIQVLKDLGAPHRKQLSRLFFFNTDVTKRTLSRLVSSVKTNMETFPHDIVILKGSRASKQLPGILLDDLNMYVGTHLLDGRVYNTTTEEPALDWKVVEVENAIANSPAVDTPLDAGALSGAVYHVDCDNVDFFDYLVFLDVLHKSKPKGQTCKIYLYRDEKTSNLWGQADKVITDGLEFESIHIKRIKESKCVVDIVIAANVAKEFALDATKPVGIVSSDSDFYPLTEMGVNLSVVYNGSYTSKDYLAYLNEKGIPVLDLNSINSSESRLRFEHAVISYLCLNHLATLPMANWTVEDITRSILSGYSKDIGYGMTLNKAVVENVVSKMLQDLKLEMIGNVVSLRALGKDMTVNLGVA